MKKAFLFIWTSFWKACPEKICRILKLTNLLLLITAFSVFGSPQQRTISGTVKDAATKEPMVGVNIQVKGTTSGVISDVNGQFSISVPSANDILVISFIGYTTQEIVPGSRTSLDIELGTELTGLDEVVVIGYGTVRRKDLTGSVSSIGNQTIQDIPVTRVEQFLGGKVAGVLVKSSSGEPGAAPQIRIRGIGSISAGADPLYVIDGFPTENIQMLNPDDIETIDILKDASATAIYGSRGANGVVLISTKRGKEGRAQISLNTYFGYQKVEKLPEMKNALQQAHYTVDGFKNRNLDGGYAVSGHPSTWHWPAPQKAIDVIEGTLTYDVNPLSEIFVNAPQQSYSLAAKGGTENIKYLISGEYLNQKGIILNSGFQRYSVRSNIDAKLTKRLLVRLNLAPSYTKRYGESNYGGGTGAVVGGAQSIHPWFTLKDENGEYTYLGGDASLANIPNPLAMLETDINNSKAMQLLGNIDAEYTILEELKYKLMLGGRLYNGNNNQFIPKLHATFDNLPDGRSSSSLSTNWLMEHTMNYTKSIGSHNMNGMVGFTTQKDVTESSSMRSRNYSNNLIPTLSAVSNILSAGTSNINEWSLISYMARVNYNFKEKYYATVSVRTDGSSRFGSKNKWGMFRSGAVAWRLSEEQFLKDRISFLQDLKIRLSYGETGNNSIGNYEQYATMSYINYPMANKPISGVIQDNIENPNLTWEKQNQYNLGVNIGLFKNRLTLNIDYFNSRNHELLLDVTTPLHSGFSSALQNIGEVKNTGWEFTVSSQNFTGTFNWTTDFNISTFRNEVLKLGPKGDPIYSGVNITKIGEPMGMFYGLLWDGIFTNQSELNDGPIYNPGASDRSRVGDNRYVDISGPDGVPDGKIDSRDYIIVGNPYPDFYFGMTNQLSYKNFSLSIHLQGVYGNDIYEQSRNDGNSGRGRIHSYLYNNDYWKSETEPGDGNTQRPNDSPTGGSRVQGSHWLDDGSFLRITNMTLSYLIPPKITQKVSVNSLNVYFTATNPVLLTKYLMYNPDASRSSNPLQPGLESYDYPLAKGFVMGLNVVF